MERARLTRLRRDKLQWIWPDSGATLGLTRPDGSSAFHRRQCQSYEKRWVTLVSSNDETRLFARRQRQIQKQLLKLPHGFRETARRMYDRFRERNPL
jgi:hypothetical protein